MRLIKILCVSFILFGAGCTNKNANIGNAVMADSSAAFNDSMCLCPPQIVIELYPYDNISMSQAQLVKSKVESFLSNYAESLVEIQPKTKIPQSCVYKPRNRYWAGRILQYEKQAFSENMDKQTFTVIGVTDKDISTSIHGQYNYGIMGYSTIGDIYGVVSSYRLKDKGDLYKIVLHEFLHTRGLRHCNDKTCMLCEGGKEISLRTTLCKKHQRQLLNIYS